jgi:hypothetical protein
MRTEANNGMNPPISSVGDEADRDDGRPRRMAGRRCGAWWQNWPLEDGDELDEGRDV